MKSADLLELAVGVPTAPAARRRRWQSAGLGERRRARSGATRPPARAPARSRTRSRMSACRDAHRCLAACQAHRRCRSRRVCRRRSGTARPARRRNAETALSQVHLRSPPTVVRRAPTRRSDGRSSARAAAAAPPASGRRAGADVGVLPAHHPVHAGRRRQLRGRRAAPARAPSAGAVSRCRNASAYSPSPARIATSSPNLHVAGRLPAAQLVVVHRRQVVVDQRVGVDQLDRPRQRQHLAAARARPPARSPAPAPAGCACRRPAASSASPPPGPPSAASLGEPHALQVALDLLAQVLRVAAVHERRGRPTAGVSWPGARRGRLGAA